jgi:hypothetical protein
MVIHLMMLIHTGDLMERGLVGNAIETITGDTMCEDNVCSKCGYKFPRPLEDALRAELAAKDAEIARRKPIPVSERMPKYFDEVLFYDGIADTWTMGYLNKGQWTAIDMLYWHDGDFARVTHWMPLPEPPEVNDGQA